MLLGAWNGQKVGGAGPIWAGCAGLRSSEHHQRRPQDWPDARQTCKARRPGACASQSLLPSRCPRVTCRTGDGPPPCRGGAGEPSSWRLLVPVTDKETEAQRGKLSPELPNWAHPIRLHTFPGLRRAGLGGTHPPPPTKRREWRLLRACWLCAASPGVLGALPAARWTPRLCEAMGPRASPSAACSMQWTRLAGRAGGLQKGNVLSGTFG